MEKTENKLVKPMPENFGWESSTQESAGGWTIEGGEEAYYKALSEYEKSSDNIDDEVMENCHGRDIPELKKKTHAEMLKEEESPLRVISDDDMGTDNGTTDPIDEKDMEELTAKPEEVIKFVIIGGNEPLVNKYFIDSLNDAGIPIKIYELSLDEIKFIVNSRAEKQAETIAVDYLNDEGYARRVKDWVVLLMQNHIKANFPSLTPEEIRRYFDGEMELLFSKKTLKEASKLAWKDFDELFNSLKLFNLVKFDEENPNLFSLTLNENEIVENQKSELRQILNIGNAVVFNLLKSKYISQDDAKNLEAVKTTILETIDKI